MTQDDALTILLRGDSVLLTGPAGSGKTFVLNKFIKQSRRKKKVVSITATTGIAATHVGGTTIHAWAGIGVYDHITPGAIDKMPKTRKEIIARTDILIIDEISMLHDYRLDMVDIVCRYVRQNMDQPFGGLQVVMSGDFYQLPPVNRAGGREGGFVVNSQVWDELDPTICYLTSQYRQDDEDLSGILNALRASDIRRSHAEKLLARTDVTPESTETLTELHTTNIDVDRINSRRLEQIDGEEIVHPYNKNKGAANYVETLLKSVLAPQELRLKKGAYVMAVKNAPNRQYANGSTGIVVEFEQYTNYPVVEFTSGKRVTMLPETWELKDGDKVRAQISQIPLRLAWAITVHKSQGMTLDAALIDLRKAFVPGMGYVALSRVKNLKNLYLAGINRTALQISDEAHKIDQELRNKSLAAK